jgi:glycosyltransferase involved in cell wall biosynthesis
VSYQKRPDILREIARRLDAEKFQVAVYGALDAEYDAAYFDGVPALRYMGGFDGVASLTARNFDVFLYTSQADGVPNILLEMMGEGVLIVAPDEGGVSEIVNDRTGVLVRPWDAVEQYVEALERLEKMRLDLTDRVAAGQKLLRERHSWRHFLDDVRRDAIRG